LKSFDAAGALNVLSKLRLDQERHPWLAAFGAGARKQVFTDRIVVTLASRWPPLNVWAFKRH